jgi:hypothetical protein
MWKNLTEKNTGNNVSIRRRKCMICKILSRCNTDNQRQWLELRWRFSRLHHATQSHRVSPPVLQFSGIQQGSQVPAVNSTKPWLRGQSPILSTVLRNLPQSANVPRLLSTLHTQHNLLRPGWTVHTVQSPKPLW